MVLGIQIIIILVVLSVVASIFPYILEMGGFLIRNVLIKLGIVKKQDDGF